MALSATTHGSCDQAAHVFATLAHFAVLTITRKRGIRDRAHAEVGCAGEVS
jgi:hypothetical protein